MSTRSIFVVTGKGMFNAEHQVVRIYKHSDGYPTHNLAVLVDATEKATCLLAAFNRGRELKDCQGLDAMQAKVFADCVIASTLNPWNGFGAQIDRDDHGRSDSGLHEGLAIFHEPLKHSHFGNQGDLEWIYVVDLKARNIAVYSGDYESPDEILPRGAVDPMSYADQLIPDAQADERSEIAAHMDKLMDLGWTFNGSATGQPAKSKTKRRRKAAVTT
jgi:hypothetical protein